MSVTQRFEASAKAAGLTAYSPDTLKGSRVYPNLMATRDEFRARLDRGASQILRGQGIRDAGPEFQRYSARVDSSAGANVSDNRKAISKAQVWEWANAFARLDNSGVRADSLVPMASQALTYFYSGVMEYAHAALPAWIGEYCRIDRQVERAAEEYVWYEMDLVGVARAASTYSTKDIPVVAGPAAQANRGNIVPFLVGMETNFMDLRREALARSNGKPDFRIYESKMKACRRVLAEAVNALWLYGDAQLGVDGLFNNPDIGTLSIVGPWSGKTALEILADLNTMINIIPSTTLYQLADMSKIKILLPPDQFNRANSLIVSSAGSESVLSFFMKTWGLKPGQIVRQGDLASANSAIWNGGPLGLSKDRAVILYDQQDDLRDPMFVLSQDIEIPAPPRQNGLSETTFFHVRAGGLKLPDARGIKFVVGL